MCKLLVISFLYFVATLSVIDSAKILGVFPTPSVSHQVVFRVLIQELVRRGHEVVMITADPAFPQGQAPANLTEIDLHDISYNYLNNLFYEVKSDNIFEYGKIVSLKFMEEQLRKFFNVLEIQAKSAPIQKLIQKKEKFDILLIEAFTRPAIAYSYFFKAPVILVSSFGATLQNLEFFGAPTHPMFYPLPFRQRLYNLSYWEKLRAYYNHMEYLWMQNENDRFDNNLVQRMFGPNIPSVSELNKNVEMIFLNVHPIWTNNQPVPPGIIFMGGLHQKPMKELPKDLKSYLDSSKNGVVYVSFGTNVVPAIFPAKKLRIITAALSELPYDILFKWNDDILPGRTKNIKNSKWFPQSDLLRHPKIKAFVMQGGLQSTDEAITAGVPLVCIPMLGDQWYNAEKYVQLNIGLKLDINTITKGELKNAIETVISNSSYRENIVKLREIMTDQPQSSLERAVWWVEHVLRHGGAKHLRSPAANIPWTQYYELKLVSVVLTCLLISVSISFLLVLRLWRYVSQFLKYNIKVKQT